MDAISSSGVRFGAWTGSQQLQVTVVLLHTWMLQIQIVYELSVLVYRLAENVAARLHWFQRYAVRRCMWQPDSFGVTNIVCATFCSCMSDGRVC